MKIWQKLRQKSQESLFVEGSQLKDAGVRQILVDHETGVNYLMWKSGYAGCITPLLDSEGKIVITKYFSDERTPKNII